MISENLESFAGKPVRDFVPEEGLPEPRETAWRIRIGWDGHEQGLTFTDHFEELLKAEGVSELEALVVGDWGGAGEGNNAARVVESLVSARERLPRLMALFIGDMTSEESEISWIQQTDMSPIWSAFPGLLEFGVRGGEGLQLGRPAHRALKKLVIEAGGLPPRVVQEVAAAQLPALEHLELWLGTPSYNGDATVDDLRPLLVAGLFPKLTYLGLRNSEIADEIAGALSGASVLGQLTVLDLSLGTLSDAGVEALASNSMIGRLKKLDIHHHYASAEAIQKLNGLGIEIDASDQREPDEWDDGEQHRYVFVSE